MSVKIHVKIIKASGLLKMDLDKSDPYVVLSINGKDKQKTQVISNTLDPIFNQEFDLVAKKPSSDELVIEMFDEDITKDDAMCNPIKIKVSEIPTDGSLIHKEEELQLKKKKEEKNAGVLEYEYSAVPGEAEKKKKDKKKDKDDSASDKKKKDKKKDDKKKDSKKKDRKSSSAESDSKKEKPVPPTKYKLYIKCTSAEKIPKADAIGKSDPYVVFNIDGYDNKVQTNFVSDTLNPVWNEDLAIDGYYLSRDELFVTVWDKDVKKDDKICGVKIPLRGMKPGHIETKQHQLYALDKKGKLDKKKKAGKILLGLQVARPTDMPFEESDWEYPIYAANIHIQKAANVPPMDIKKSDPYVQLQFNDGHKSTTKVVDNNLNPEWDEKFSWLFEELEGSNVIHLSLWDKDVSKDDKISTLDVDIGKCELGTVYEYTQSMKPHGKVQSGGELSYRVHVTRYGEQAFDEDGQVEERGGEINEDEYILHIKICQAKDIVKADANESDGYVKLYVDNGEKCIQTKAQKNTLNPVWNQINEYKPVYADSQLKLELWDKDLIKDDHIDDLEIDLAKYPVEQVHKEWFNFQKQGQIELWIHLAKPGQAPFLAEKKEGSSSSMHTCSFSWGSYSSSKYSTDFHGYTKGESLSSLSSSEEKKIKHNHELKEKKHKDKKEGRKDCIIKVISADSLFVPEACKGVIQPYCVANAAGRNHISKTSVIKDTVTPEWNEEVHVKKVEASDSIELTIFDKNKILKDQPLGYAKIPLSEIFDDQEHDATYDLEKPPTMKDAIAAFAVNGFGHIHVSVSFK